MGCGPGETGWHWATMKAARYYAQVQWVGLEYAGVRQDVFGMDPDISREELVEH